MNYPAASSGVSKTLNSVIPHLMRNPVRSSGFRLEFIPYLIRDRNDELAASGGEYNPKGFNPSPLMGRVRVISANLNRF